MVEHVTTHDQHVVKGGQKLELIIKSTSTYQMIGIFILHSALPKLRTANDHRGGTKMATFKKYVDWWCGGYIKKAFLVENVRWRKYLQ